MDKPRIEVVIPTKNRYEFLALTLQSLTNQTYDNWDLIIIEDSDPQYDINAIPFISPMLRWMENNKHEWRVFFGPKQGPHKCHQIALNSSKHNYILRVDDDCPMSDRYIEELVKTITEQEHCGAVGGVLLDPTKPQQQLIMPENWKDIKDFSGNIWEENGGIPCHSPALQWFIHRDKDIKPVQHLHSSFLYRKAVALAVDGWSDMELSKVGMTEETRFSYKLFLQGWNLFVNPNAVAWHMKAPVGGTRENNNKEDLSKLYYSDRIKFDQWYKGVREQILKSK